MGYSRKLGPLVVWAAVTMIILTSLAILTIVKHSTEAGYRLFGEIWPISLTSAAGVVLVMTFLYSELSTLVRELESREHAARIEAMHDRLTGLGNRALLEERLTQGLMRYRRAGEKFALLILDLDRFKQVNDALGHAAGDLLVQQVGQRLNSIVRKTDTVARLGGDEFAIIQTMVQDEADVHQLCSRILEVITEHYVLGDSEARVGVSVGAILVGPGVRDGSELLRKADITMYRAKASGRNCYRIFSSEMESAVQRRNHIEQRLRRAIEHCEGLELHYQPQIDRSGEIVGVEGLLRWSDVELGAMMPAEVIPIAEECGLIADIGIAAMRLACRTARAWPRMFVAVNLSPLQFRDPDLAARVRRIAGEEGVSPSQIELEITESLLIDHSDRCEQSIRRMRDDGFRIALDDFGTGYSSLSFLRRFPIDKVKLDRSFLDVAQVEESSPIIRAAVTLGHAMKLKVVAEGIASRQQERIALDAGCDLLQGYRYSRALSTADLSAFLSDKVRFAVAAGG